jgi:hypothetical protein
MGLDGKPRPINIEHGSRVLQWDRDNEFIETRRHWFTGKVAHHTGGGVNVLNVIEG